MLQTAVSYMQLNKPQLAQLRTIATTTNTNRSATYAQNILCFGYGECDWEQTEPQARLKSSYPKRSYDFKNIPSIAVNNQSTNATISPNPTTGSVTVLISGLEKNARTQFNLKNMSGQLVMEKQLSTAKTQLNLERLNKGIYLYDIVSNGTRIAVGKLVIQ